MSTFKEIIDTIGGLEGELAAYVMGGRKHRSLSKSAQEGVLNFPVIVSDSLSIEDASLVSKALEKEFASFVLTVCTMNPYLYTHGAPNAQKYIHKLHQNIDTRGDFTDIQNAAINLIGECAAKLGVEYDQLAEGVDYIMYHVYEGVNYSGINKENLKFSYSIQEIVDHSILNDMVYRPTKEDIRFGDNSHMGVGYNGNHDGDVEINNTYGDVNVSGRDMGREIGRALAGNGGPGGRGSAQYKDVKFIMDNDYKKANELVPTLIHIRIFPVDRMEDVRLDPIDFVLGVKATLHPVSTDEIVVNVVRGIKNDDKIFNFIRWQTGEIKFFKDFLFTMGDLKLDAVNTSSKTSKWWTMLKRRKSLAKIKNHILPDKLLPNATIIITQEELDIIRDQYGYDLSNQALVYKLMNAYFLIAFVIVDPALQRVKFLFDGKTDYETLTYATLAREATTNDKQFKEMLNMLGRRI